MVEPPFVCENSTRFSAHPEPGRNHADTDAVHIRSRRGSPRGAEADELTEKVLYGDVWERPGLSKRDRNLITVAALVALYRSDQLKGHLERALANGVTREEIGELITHRALYSGWPTAMTAARIAKGVFETQK
jgi:4-carboxymuconolactone decarboxylase